ncbi:TBC1 domain family member 13-like isoform X2 [Ornithodoros turicata]|uniref:TBC1 domain family member 13-like isoform X2 n=1 Tax=Ornithodoros turicata TaxID=34597 RepID=UPI003139B593
MNLFYCVCEPLNSPLHSFAGHFTRRCCENCRLEKFEEVLKAPEVNFTQLKSLCFQGIPDHDNYRPMCWRLLLGYLPANTSEWPETLRRQRNVYERFIEEMIICSGSGSPEGPQDDHPLNPNPDSRWQTFFKDNDVLLQIDKDVRRLCPDICFFQRQTEYPCMTIMNNPQVETLRKRVERTALNSANVTRNRSGITNISLYVKQSNEHYERLPDGQEAHWEVVERILFLYAKLNPGVGYVQGMNEIIGPIYYTFAADPNPEWKRYAEADCFFCFTSLMSEIRDFFLKTLDDSASGIGAMMHQLMCLLQTEDFDVYSRLQTQEVRPQYYSFRWITLLLSQEFPLPDVIRIWDSLLSDSNRFSFLIFICCAMIVKVRDQLLQGDFPSNMKLLQNFPETDINDLLKDALTIMENNRHRSIFFGKGLK